MIDVAQQTPITQQDSGATGPIRVLVVDDHPAVRAGLLTLLEDEPDLVVTEAVASGEEALAVAEREWIDVAVVDYQLGDRSGLWVSRKLKRLARPPLVILYSAYSDGMLAAASVVAEADGLLDKSVPGSELCDAIRAVARGSRRLPPVPAHTGAILRQRLDHEEQAIFGMLLAGIAPPEVAATLGVPAAGLESRLWAMLKKIERPAPPAAERILGAVA